VTAQLLAAEERIAVYSAATLVDVGVAEVVSVGMS